MIPVLAGILGCYALAVIVIHVYSALRRGRVRSAKHYVLIAGNEGHQMEWYMRSLRRFSHLTGTEVKVTVVDSGSEDETIHIVRCFAKQNMDVHYHSTAGHSDKHSAGDDQMNEGAPATSAEPVSSNSNDAGQAKWQRFRGKWGSRQDDTAMGQQAAEPGEQQPGRSMKRLMQGKKGMSGPAGKSLEPTHLLWMLQAEGVVSVKEHAVLIDLRDPADLSKLPF
ncbi:glycosyltransferase family A protein [Paenibacillus sp. R14(2021)]|uniref:glycosyltransferase family A protein n=1 Tax=Paenibacillus sp. R14(2021) TaxID=2859228 RepID=UPI001C615533|nr:glycosyltransferase family A protein [Paenibacillus sp. R14(2021)]